MPLPPPSPLGRLLLLVAMLAAVLTARPVATTPSAAALAPLAGAARATETAQSTGTAGPPAGSVAVSAVVDPRAGTIRGTVITFRPPLDGALVVTRRFEPPATPYGPGHRGVDFADPPGTPVVAAAGGTVTFAGSVAGRGVITVTHGELRTTYEPVTPTVRIGQVVDAGQELGRLTPGHHGCPASACLHWGLLRGAVYLDPLSVLRRLAPRLLPLDAPAR